MSKWQSVRVMAETDLGLAHMELTMCLLVLNLCQILIYFWIWYYTGHVIFPKHFTYQKGKVKDTKVLHSEVRDLLDSEVIVQDTAPGI